MYRSKYVILTAALCLAATMAKAQLAVAIAADPMWPVEAARWAEQIAQATQAVEQAREMVSQAKQLRDIAGNPRDALAHISDLSNIAETVGGLTDKTNTADKIVANLDEVASLSRTAGGLRDAITEDIDVFGKSLKRDVTDLESALKYEAVVAKTRELIEENRKTQKRLSTQLRDAIELLKSANTQSKIATAQAEVQRITALMEAGDLAMRNLVEDARMKKEEFEVARELEVSALVQEVKEKSLAVADEVEKQREAFGASVGKALSDGEKAAVDTRSMFERALLPSAN